MVSTIKTFRLLVVVLISIGLFANSGCESKDKKETSGSASESDDSTSSSVGDKGDDKETTSDSDTISIDGDLSAADWRSMIGEEVTIKGDLVVVDTFNLIRRGQIRVARNRLYVPTNQIDPNDAESNGNSYEGGSNVANVTKAQKRNDESTIIIDDGSDDQAIFPPKLFPNLGSANPTVRVGSIVQGVSGKLVEDGNRIFLVPNGPLRWTPAERPNRPDVGEADVTVASFNVLNFFTTIDDGSNNARGADSASELRRQQAKLVSAIVTMDADVIGLMEIENNIEAENKLVAALNAKIGKEVFTGCGLPEGFRGAPGGVDAIRVGIIYRSDRVSTVGEVSMISDDAFEKARVPVVQEFTSKTLENPFTLVVNHFKSKGGSSRADAANKNKGDGQGAFNALRRSQALAICNYIDELEQAKPEARVLVIGDLNAYGQEDPIDAMRAKGLVDLTERFEKSDSSTNETESYSYVYRGQAGSLDHSIATEALAKDVTGVATWHINADEPRFVDYNEEYNPEQLYKANPYRSSDHDPVLIGIGD